VQSVRRSLKKAALNPWMMSPSSVPGKAWHPAEGDQHVPSTSNLTRKNANDSRRCHLGYTLSPERVTEHRRSWWLCSVTWHKGTNRRLNSGPRR
jgi:hypothetical protein